MKTGKMILPMVCCIPLMSSCATDKPMEKPAWNIQPVYKVNNVAADNPNALYQLGRYYQGQRRYALAAESYHKALAADDGFVEAHNGLGVIYSMQGKYDAAVTEFKIAISQASKSGHLYNNLGHTLYLQGAYAEAVSALEQAVSLDPGNPRTLNNLGLAYAKAGEVGKSRQVFAEAAKPMIEDSIVAAPRAPAQADVAQPARVESDADAGQVIAIQEHPVQTPEPPVQTLALPKDRGVITSAPVAPVPVSVTETPVETVQALPNVSEPSKRAELVPTTVREPNTQVVSKAASEVSITAAEVQPSTAVPTDSIELRTVVIPQVLLHLEVSNGNGTTGMARKVAYFLQESGYAKARLTNRKPFTVQTTQIQYRSGHQLDAEHLRASLPRYAAMVESNSLRDDINLRVVLGKDLVQHTAYFNGNTQKLLVTHNDLDS